ncbi:hypothetical protein ADUPG1_006113 [Aduncisulcus paluster]|uniref:Secreted protein n=1 Tax=Aduncisulcus paluster TaxID=2918883 RepID=A0ABQ5KJX5_9EUKA|nr:hypothetical protein ADUPG1_006113 [Aduncisulcus paluster]
MSCFVFSIFITVNVSSNVSFSSLSFTKSTIRFNSPNTGVVSPEASVATTPVLFEMNPNSFASDSAITDPVAPVSRSACISFPLSVFSLFIVIGRVKSVPDPIL